MSKNNATESNIRQPTEEQKRVKSKKTVVKNSGYSQGGASIDKNSLKGYDAISRTPIEDIDKNLTLLRQRARNLYMTAPVATSAIKNNRTNVVGQGLHLKCRINRDILGLTQEQADLWERRTEQYFLLWAESKFCDIKRLDNFFELQQTALTGWLMNGDAFALLRKGTPVKMQPFDLRIQLIESDRVTTENSMGTFGLIKELEDGNRVVNGVEINSLGEVVAYWICNCYPNEHTTKKKKWTRVVAFGEETYTQNVIHVIESERAEQYRGVPYLAPVIEVLKQLTNYTDAEIMAALVNAIFAIFIETDPDNEEDSFDGTDDDEEGENDRNVGSNEIRMGSGTIHSLAPGERVKPVDPSRPNVNFDLFVTAMSKQIGAALEVPEDILLKKFDASYSASRASQMEAWKAFRMRRTWFINDFCQPIYEAWLTEAIIKGYIKAPGFFTNPLVRKAWTTAEWSGPAQGQIDPIKEVTAADKRVASGFSTIEQETMLINGGDYDKNMEQRKLEKRKMAELEEVKK